MASKHHWRVWGVPAVSGPRWVSPLTACVLSPSTLLRLQLALQGSCLKWALGCVHFPGLSHSGSGSRVLHRGADSVGPAFCALPRSEQLRRQVPGERPLPGCSASYRLPIRPLGFLGAQRECRLRCVPPLLWGADLWLQPSRQMPTVQDPSKTCLATGSLLAVW